MTLHSCTPEPAESDDKGRATPTQALIGILEGAAAIIGARCNDLNAAELRHCRYRSHQAFSGRPGLPSYRLERQFR
ncbi:hypothetical protein [Mycobacteroides chelonae]|jgi:hypothetical protein|uniref:Uncharacterized protein n=1 Tax=Mycobacteroides chelonae TaxID=1774 RepID=A0AB73TYH8_MYCCH|nr:hypothetical protein [Mycobacteroides chelonae]MBF9317161.1 hypothetical protein [Mycobacteroides chelonae]QDF69631.1 hypothetical protein FJK96_05365 [Mycobacteroides chelonae]